MKSNSIFGFVTRIAASVMSSRTNTHHHRVETHSERCKERERAAEERWNAKHTHTQTRSSRKMSFALAFDRFDATQPQNALASMRAVCRLSTRQDHACV